MEFDVSFRVMFSFIEIQAPKEIVFNANILFLRLLGLHVNKIL